MKITGNPNLAVGSLVRPRGALKSVALWDGRRDEKTARVMFRDIVMGHLTTQGVVVEVVEDKALVLTESTFGWTYFANLCEAEG